MLAVCGAGGGTQSFRIIMQRAQASGGALEWRGLPPLVLLFRACSGGVAAAHVLEQHYTRTFAKTPNPSS